MDKFVAALNAIALLESMDQIYARQLRGTEVDADPNGTKAFLDAMNGRSLTATGTTPLVKQTARRLSAALKKADGASSNVIPVLSRKVQKQFAKAVAKIEPTHAHEVISAENIRMLKAKKQFVKTVAKIEPTHAHEVINVRRLKVQNQFVKAIAKIEPTHAHEVISAEKIRMLKAKKQFVKAIAKIEPTHAHEVVSAEKIRELASAKKRGLEEGQMPEGWGDCSCQMGACAGGDDPDCATPFTSCMYWMWMSGCETTTMKYPDGSDMMTFDGCPVDTIIGCCTNCEWMSTQNTCTDEMLPPCLLDAFPYLAEVTGGYSPHRTVASDDSSSSGCSGGDCDQADQAGCDQGGCDGQMPEGWGDCSCQMGACAGGDDPDCATPFTSCMYWMWMSGCETTTMKYPDGSDMMTFDGCPVDTIIGCCTNCEWMSTQNTCTDEMLPPCLLDAFPYLAEVTGGYSPHRTVAGGDSSNGGCSGSGCDQADCNQGSDCGECCEGGSCGGDDCTCEDGDCECCEKEEESVPDCNEGGSCDGQMPEGWGDCSCQMGACAGGDDPDCATPFTSCMYWMWMSGCETTTMKYPDGSDMMTFDGCPVDTIIGCCTNCEWMSTQNTCTDEMLPPCLLDAFPYLAEVTGGYSPHRTVAGGATGGCSGGDCDQGGDCNQGSDCSGTECCEGGSCGGDDCACENCDCECCEKEDEGPAPCTAQMGECTGGPDKDCATMFTSTLYYNWMNGCEAQTILYPDGSVCDSMSIEGCPVDEIMMMCEHCEWMGTQNTCHDAKLPPCLLDALPYLAEVTGGFAPHTAAGQKGMARMAAKAEAAAKKKAEREAAAAKKKAEREAAAAAKKAEREAAAAAKKAEREAAAAAKKAARQAAALAKKKARKAAAATKAVVKKQKAMASVAAANEKAAANAEKAAANAEKAAANAAKVAAKGEERMAKLCSCAMGDCLGGPDPACATGLAECMYGNVMNGCPGTSLKYPASMGGAEMAYVEGCPVSTLAGFCAGCEWMGTQDLCYDTTMSPEFAAAYPYLVEMIGAAVWPHAGPRCSGGDCSGGDSDCSESSCRELQEETDARQLAASWSELVKNTPKANRIVFSEKEWVSRQRK